MYPPVFSLELNFRNAVIAQPCFCTQCVSVCARVWVKVIHKLVPLQAIDCLIEADFVELAVELIMKQVCVYRINPF